MPDDQLNRLAPMTYREVRDTLGVILGNMSPLYEREKMAISFALACVQSVQDSAQIDDGEVAVQ